MIVWRDAGMDRARYFARWKDLYMGIWMDGLVLYWMDAWVEYQSRRMDGLKLVECLGLLV